MRNKRAMQKKFVPIVSLLLIILLLVFQQQLNYTWHYHKLSNGLLIRHSHPFNHTSQEKSGEQHTHHGKEFLFFSFIDGSYNNASIHSYFNQELLAVTDTYYICEHFVADALYRVNKFRGPPVF